MKAIARGLWCLTILLTLTVTACSTPDRELDDGLYAEILTGKGDIVVRLYPERAPITVMNFVGLAEGTIENDHAPGDPFYDGLTFHRVEPGFVIQGGDPSGDGTGGPGYRFPTETHPELLHDKAGVVAMANSGPDTNGSQFYITMGPTPHLDGGYNVFGEVVEGMEVVTSIEVGDRIREVNILRFGDEAEEYEASDEAFEGLVNDLSAAREAGERERREAALDAARERWPGIAELDDTGVLIASLERGSGNPPEQGETIAVHIVFSLLDGTQLDSTVDRGEPQRVRYLQDRLIRGLEIAVGTLREGGRAVAIVPPELAFGQAGLPPAVPPNSHVVFEIERVD
ncbi:MAG: peptidylprolyl isomerase [Spirochaetota bacterium]